MIFTFLISEARHNRPHFSNNVTCYALSIDICLFIHHEVDENINKTSREIVVSNICNFPSSTEREKQVSIKGDEPTVKYGRRSLNSDATQLTDETQIVKITAPIDLENSNENHVQLSGLGRYGSEWPS